MGKNIDPKRLIALALGEKYYLSDKPCRHGHLAYRSTRSNLCTECAKNARPRNAAYQKRYRKANPAKVKFLVRRWQMNNSVRMNQNRKKLAANPTNPNTLIYKAKEAKKLGLTTFKASGPCKYNHAPFRNVSDLTCVECRKLKYMKGKI